MDDLTTIMHRCRRLQASVAVADRRERLARLDLASARQSHAAIVVRRTSLARQMEEALAASDRARIRDTLDLDRIVAIGGYHQFLSEQYFATEAQLQESQQVLDAKAATHLTCRRRHNGLQDLEKRQRDELTQRLARRTARLATEIFRMRAARKPTHSSLHTAGPRP